MASQTSSDQTPQAPNEHPIKHFRGGEQQSDNDDTSTIYFKAYSQPASPSQEYTTTDLKHELVKVHKERLEIMNRLASHESLPSPEPLKKGLGDLGVSFALITVIHHMSHSDYMAARYMARRALKKAKKTDDEILIARCYYWLGRIEFELRNFTAAYVYFSRARPCVMDDMNPEGEDLDFYLNFSRSGISNEYRKRVVREHNQAIVEAVEEEEQEKSQRRVVVKPEKRKRDKKTWEPVLRPAPDRSSPGQVEKKTEKGKLGRGKPTVWMIHDTADLHQYRDQPPESKDKDSSTGDQISNPQGQGWDKAQQSQPPLEGRRFTFRCCLRELAPRTRPTNIFSPQPCEVILSPEQWDYVREGIRGKRISISYLAYEREIMRDVMRHREAEAREEQADVPKVGIK